MTTDCTAALSFLLVVTDVGKQPRGKGRGGGRGEGDRGCPVVFFAGVRFSLDQKETLCDNKSREKLTDPNGGGDTENEG